MMPFFPIEIPASNHSSRILLHTTAEREREREREERSTTDGRKHTHTQTRIIYMASRVLANLLVACSGAVFRAASQAWSKALQNAKASGVHAEHHVKKKTTSGGGFGTNGVSLDEAKKILPISTDDTKEQMLAKFDRAFAKNDDVSFYLQSKLFRAKETLGKEVFGMTEEEASADPRKKRKEEEDKEGHRKSEGEKTTTTTNRKDALPNDDDKNAPTTTEKE
jgi:hypothetical protein